MTAMTASLTTAPATSRAPMARAPGTPEAPVAAAGGFSQLLAQATGAAPAAAAATATPMVPQKLTIPGDPAQADAALAGLAAQIGALAESTAEALAEGPLAPAELQSVMTDAATKLGELLAEFDAATGADALPVLTANLAQPGAAPFAEMTSADPQTFAAAFASGVAGLLGLAAPTAAPVPTQPMTVALTPLTDAPITALPVAAGAQIVTPPRLAGQGAQPGPRGATATGDTVVAAAPGTVQPQAPAASNALSAAEPASNALSAAKPASNALGAMPPQAAAPTEAAPVTGQDFKALLQSTLQSATSETGPAPIQTEPLRGAETLAPAKPQPTGHAAPPPPSGFSRGLANQIRSSSFSEGQTRITLMPRGLGEVEIELRPDEAGTLRIVLRAENQTVLQALRGDREGLLSVLADGGVAVEDGQLSFEGFGDRGAARDQRGGDTGQPGAGAESLDEIATTAIPIRVVADGRVDITT